MDKHNPIIVNENEIIAFIGLIYILIILLIAYMYSTRIRN